MCINRLPERRGVGWVAISSEGSSKKKSERFIDSFIQESFVADCNTNGQAI